MDVKSILRKYELFFSENYTVNQIINAIHVYCLKGEEIPKVCHLEKVLNPAKAEITTAEYVNAQKAQERNNFPQYSAEAMLIRDYEAQQSSKYGEEKRPELIENKKVLEIVSDCVKRV